MFLVDRDHDKEFQKEVDQQAKLKLKMAMLKRKEFAASGKTKV